MTPTKFNQDLETTPAKGINEITSDYQNPQGIVKANNFKPLESSYVGELVLYTRPHEFGRTEDDDNPSCVDELYLSG